MTPDSTPDDLIEELVFQCLELGGDDAALDKVTQAHPGLRAEVARVLASLHAPIFASDHASPPTPDRLGEFVLEGRIGEGGMGVVYLARQTGLDRRVALKVIRADQLHFDGARERFRREVQAVSRLQHPNIVPVFAVGEHDGMPYFTMEYVEGCSLGSALRALCDEPPAELSGQALARCAGAPAADDGSGSGSEGTGSRVSIFAKSWVGAASEIARQMAEALHHAHERGVLHRDVKPSNILISADGRPWLMDFGLAKTEGTQSITHTASHLGSLPYMAPEQLRGGSTPHATLDVYGLGVTLYEMLALRNPFLDGDPELTRRNILESRIPSLRERNRAVSRDLETVCLVALDPDPNKRYRSALEFAADLENVANLRPIAVRRPSWWGRSLRYARRKPAASVAIALAALLLVGVPLALYLQERSARAKIETEAAVAAQTTRILIGLFEAAGPAASIGEQPAIEQFLAMGSSHLRSELRDQPEVKARMLSTLGRVYDNLGNREQAIDHLVEAEALLATHVADDTQSLTLVRWELAAAQRACGRYTESARLYEVVVGALRRGDSALPLANARSGHGLTLHMLGRHVDAESMLRAAADTASEQAEGSIDEVRCLTRLAVYLVDVGRSDEALPILRQATATAENLDALGQGAILYSHLCRCLTEIGSLDEARAAMARCDELAAAAYGDTHLFQRVFEQQRATLLRACGDLDGAEQAYGRALAIAERDLGENHVEVGMAANGLGTLLLDRARAADALPLTERACAIYDASDASPRRKAMVQGNRASALAGVGRFDQAERGCRRALQSLEAIDPDSTGPLWNTLAWILIQRGNPTDARAANDRAVARFEARGHATLLFGRALAMRALLCNQTGRPDAALAAAQRAIAVLTEAGAHRSVDVGLSHNHIGWAREIQGKLEASIEAYRQSIATFDAVAPDHPDAAYPLNGLAMQLLRRDAETAVPLLQRALELRERFLLEGNMWLRISSHNLAVAQHLAGQDEAAIGTMASAIRRARPSGGLVLAGSLYFGARIHRRLQRLESAAELAGEAAGLFAAASAEMNAQRVRVEQLLGELQLERGQFAEAEPPLLRSLRWLRENRGDDAPETLGARTGLAELYTKWGKPDRAREFSRRPR